MANKTKKEYFAEIRAIVIDNPELVAFVDHQVDLLDKKSATPRKPTATQLENIGFKNDILIFLTDADKPMNIKEIQNGIPALADKSNQRIARLLTDLVNAEKVVRTVVKGTPYFAIA